MRNFSAMLLLGAISLLCAPGTVVAAGAAARQLPGLQLDGSVLLPNQWSLRPAGRQLEVGDFPVNMAVNPTSSYVAVLHSGYGEHEVRVIDLEKGSVSSKASFDESFYGLVWSPDGRKLYVSGAGGERIHSFRFEGGKLGRMRDIVLRPETEEGVPIGVAVSGDGRSLYVAEGWGQRVLKVDAVTGRIQWTCVLAAAAKGASTDPEGPRVSAADDPAAPFPYAVVVDEKRGRVYVSLWAKASVLVLNARTGQETARWPVGPHPNEMALSRDGRLFVAEANRNTVSALDVSTGKVQEVLSPLASAGDLPGAMPNSVALSPDERRLFVANATANTVAVFDISACGEGVSLGFVPVGWFPTSVRMTADGRTLLVANGKGLSSAANPKGPFPGNRLPWEQQQYIGRLLRGAVSFIDWPSGTKLNEQMAVWTKQALTNQPHRKPAEKIAPGGPIPTSSSESSPIKYVIYVVKENRTYDQIFGDLRQGNGDQRLCLFPDDVTPNHHALAREFVLLDNFYVDGEVSADGHEWTMGAFATDFVEKTWPLNYGHGTRKKIDYPGEGRYPLSVPTKGYLWDQAAKAGITYRSYGEFIRSGDAEDDEPVPAIPVLQDHFDPGYRPFDLGYPDVRRIERFAEELKRFEKEGEMPRLQVVRIGNDHTEGTKPGRLTPTAMVADNDLALGKLVEVVSHSKFWPNTAIFVVEDDAQNGPDHVDAHRSVALVASPYTRRHSVDSTMYSTSSMLRTIELILGLSPMSQYDALAAPLYACFQNKADVSPYEAKRARADLTARNTELSWGARRSKHFDFREADRVDDLALNEVIWKSVKGADSPMPAPVRAAFLKVSPKVEDDD